MKFVLANIVKGKIDGIYGGPYKKHFEILNYIESFDVRRYGKKYDKLDDAVKVQKDLNELNYIASGLPANFEIICLAEYPDDVPAAEIEFYAIGHVGYTTGEYPTECGKVIKAGTLVGVTAIGLNGYSIQTMDKKALKAVGIGWRL